MAVRSPKTENQKATWTRAIKFPYRSGSQLPKRQKEFNRLSWWDRHRSTRGSLMVGRTSRRDCARDWIKSTLRIRKKKANISSHREQSWQNFQPWRREQGQGSKMTERRKHQEGRTQPDFSSVRLNPGGKTGGNMNWDVRNLPQTLPRSPAWLYPWSLPVCWAPSLGSRSRPR